jgi:hypothetical protein
MSTILIGRRGLALVCALLAFAVAATAQAPGGQRRTRTDRPGADERQPAQTRFVQAPDPVLALEHELPSLRVDLNLTPEQKALWGPFERSLRDAAELTRQRTKKLLAPRPVDAPAPNALGVVSALADDERMRADAMADAAARLKTLYESLTPAQRALFDRRALLAQSEPLGTQ